MKVYTNFGILPTTLFFTVNLLSKIIIQIILLIIDNNIISIIISHISKILPPFHITEHLFDYLFDYLCNFSENKNLKNAVFTRFFRTFRAGDERIELPPKVLETPIIPFDQSPVP